MAKDYRYNENDEGYKYSSYSNPDDESEFAYTATTTNGRPKTLLWSIFALVLGILTVLLSYFGWVGIIFGVLALVMTGVARKFLGFFNGLTLVGLMSAIFGLVISVVVTVLSSLGML